MLSTGWFGCVFELEGVLVKSRYEEHRTSWMLLAAEREERPPPEMVAFLRSKREQLKALKSSHSSAVSEAAGQLSELELDAAEEMGLSLV